VAAEKKLYAVLIRWVASPASSENFDKVDKALGSIGVWLRFSGYGWLVETEKSALEIFHVLANILRKDDSEIVIRVDPEDYAGWAFKWVDEWIAQKGRKPAASLQAASSKPKIS
jgi:hypothetical protein